MVLVGHWDPMTALQLSDHVHAPPTGFNFANGENYDYKAVALPLGSDYALGATSMLSLPETLT